MVRLCVQKQLLKSAIEYADGFLLIDSLVALQPFYHRIPGRGDRLGESRLSASRWSLNDDRLLHARGEVDHLKRNRIDYVLRRIQAVPEIIDR